MRETLYIERPPQTLRKHNNTPHRRVSTLQFALNRKWKANEAQLSPKLYRQLQTQHPTNQAFTTGKLYHRRSRWIVLNVLKHMKIITKDTLNHQNYIEDHSDQLKQLHKKFATYACGSGYSNVASMHRLW